MFESESESGRTFGCLDSDGWNMFRTFYESWEEYSEAGRRLKRFSRQECVFV
jgi:hypothetical protein